MKIYILTHCAAEENYTPEAYLTKKEAVEALKETYDKLVAPGYILEKNLYKEAAIITYLDDSYDRLDIFEVELN